MIRASRYVVATAALPMVALAAFAADADRQSPYSPINLLTFFRDETRAELKVTADQARALKASEERRNKIWKDHCQAVDKARKAGGSAAEQNARLRALEAQVVSDLCKAYGETLRPAQVKRMKQIVLQIRGMEIFDFPEIRSSLKIGDKEARQLHSAWDRLASEMAKQLRADVQAKKITNQDAAQVARSMKLSVPDSIRGSLSQEQQQVLNDLLGEKFVYKK